MSVRVAVIGCGWWATYAHLPALQSNPRAEIAALVEHDPARLAAAGLEFGVPATYTDPERMLAEVELDAVVIAAPNALHHPLAKLALEAGKHVLVEKPMTIEPADARELTALAGERGVQLLVGYPLHYNAQTLALRAAIASGAIGEIEHVACLYASIVRELYRGDPEPYRDVVFGYPVNPPAARTYADPTVSGGGQGQSQISHAAALLLWLTGLRPRDVFAFSNNFELPVDLVDTLAIRFQGGALGALSSTGSVTPGQEEVVRYEIFGREGHILFDVNQGSASIHRDGRVELLPALAQDLRWPIFAPVENLVGVALGEQRNGSPAEVALGAVELISAMYTAARECRAVSLEEL
jgi:predicted dehydrogenase